MGTESLGEVIPKECARVREIQCQYRALGPAGSLAAMMMEVALRNADHAMISGGVCAMMKAYEDLKGFTE